jgi:glyoxylase I family protein
MKAFRFTHIDHCTILITNLEKARHFYGELLGLREIAPPKEFDFVAVWYDLGGQYLHLLLKPQPDTLSARHFCLHVSDIAAAREHYKALNIPMDETVKIAAADRFFLRDPDGNRVEILHWQRAYDPETDGRITR